MAEPIVFKFSTSVIAIPFGVAAVGIVVGAVCLAVGKKGPAVVSLLVALIAGLVFGPSMLLDRVVVSTDNSEKQQRRKQRRQVGERHPEQTSGGPVRAAMKEREGTGHVPVPQH